MTVTVYSNEASIDWNAKGVERIVQNVRNILRTRQFEVPFMRDLGINQDFTDATHKTLKTDLITHISSVIATHEPRATVLDVRIESYDDNGDCVIAVDLEV